ncbi:hypothetical protein CEXT_689611 [Caerostris extrusa]|uniref:Uncharacterized protein n=1 Tax=Caerostris extrusa TaxID=172846 RepID=A0AAV4RB74_CAEEX|nr:hypothetical protein CEXT_689611 [Caerostris extrusa]
MRFSSCLCYSPVPSVEIDYRRSKAADSPEVLRWVILKLPTGTRKNKYRTRITQLMPHITHHTIQKRDEPIKSQTLGTKKEETAAKCTECLGVLKYSLSMACRSLRERRFSSGRKALEPQRRSNRGKFLRKTRISIFISHFFIIDFIVQY